MESTVANSSFDTEIIHEPVTIPAETKMPETEITSIVTELPETETSSTVTTPLETESIEDKILKVNSDNLYSFINSYKNNVYNSLFEMNGKKYGRIISSSDSAEDAVRVCTRHFTDNRYPQSVNAVAECNVIYETDILYGINVKWELYYYGELSGQYEENVISFKKNVADITVRNVIYGDEESYSISASEEITEQIVLYLCYNKYYWGYDMLDYEMLSYDNEYIMTIYVSDEIRGDWDTHDQIVFQKYIVVIDKKNGLVQFREPIELKTVLGYYNHNPYME